MSSALSIAAGGIQAAARSFETAARNVVTASTGLAASVQTPAPAPSRPPVGAAPVALSQPVADIPDLTGSLIDLKVAEISYKAQIEVFKVADRLQDETLDMIA